MECADEAKEGNYGGEFMKDEKSSNVRDWGILESREGRTEELGCAGEDALNAVGLGGRRRRRG